MNIKQTSSIALCGTFMSLFFSPAIANEASIPDLPHRTTSHPLHPKLGSCTSSSFSPKYIDPFLPPEKARTYPGPQKSFSLPLESIDSEVLKKLFSKRQEKEGQFVFQQIEIDDKRLAKLAPIETAVGLQICEYIETSATTAVLNSLDIDIHARLNSHKPTKTAYYCLYSHEQLIPQFKNYKLKVMFDPLKFK